MKKKIYIAGPMTGLPDLNFPAFHGEAAWLRGIGYEVINPAEINPDPTAKWEDCMKADIPQLVTCDGIHLLAGWEKSRGARLEHHIATELGMTITFSPPSARRTGATSAELFELRGSAACLNGEN